MRRPLTWGMALLFVSLMAMSSMAAKEMPIKIGVIDIQKIMRESKGAKSAQAVYLKDREAKFGVLAAKGKEIRTMEEELKGNTKLSEEERKNKADALAKDVKEYKRLDSDLGEELKKKDVELTRKIYGEIMNTVQHFAKKEHYTLILEKNSAVASDESIDVTDKIIKLYDAEK